MECRIEENLINYQCDYEGNEILKKDIIKSWNNNLNYELLEEKLRKPQLGALYALKSHFTISNNEATIVMPTGTGKTETMLSYIVSEKIEQVLIILPSLLLREQTYNKCKTLGLISQFKILGEKALLPNVCLLKKTPSDKTVFENITQNVNIIVSTIGIISRLNDEQISVLKKTCNAVIIDEAHHIAARTWNDVKSKFKDLKIIQFTATPFRNDNKKIDGKIIYNYPLSNAQREGYFTKINFNPVVEYDISKSDIAVAKKSISILKNDIENGYDHVLLVRAGSKKRASDLYEKIYKKYYNDYNPVLITSDQTKSANKDNLSKLRSLESRIVVCVDMFGEGIDLPNLKIAAIHDKYKSLPITLQFIGRFARVSNRKIGNASLVANIMIEEVNEEIKQLYSLDSNWDYVISDLSKTAIGKEISFQEFMSGFDIEQLRDISVKQLVPKVSMVAYRTDIKEWQIDNWKKIFNEELSVISINEENNTFVIIEAIESPISWTSNKIVTNKILDLHVVYWNKEKNTVFINSSNKMISNMIADKIFNTTNKINGDVVFRALSGINRLMMASVGLRTAINGPIRYKMYAGIDIASGISDSAAGTSIKSNIFGTGYNGNGKVSIGCSYKGTIWSKWVETVDYWKNWCDNILDKLLDNSINTQDILNSALVPRVINKRPTRVPISIDWPDELAIEDYNKYWIKCGVNEYNLDEIDLKIANAELLDKNITFLINNLQFQLEITDKGYKFINLSGKKVELFKNNNSMGNISNYFNENPPRIFFDNQSSLEGNLYVEINKDLSNYFHKDRIVKENWENIDISVESQTKNKIKNSIQYHIINKLKSSSKYQVIFDDDGSGEIADIVTLRDEEKCVYIELYHCKFSGKNTPGKRINDLYEVCGQCQKSIKWRANIDTIIDHMLHRENLAQENNYSRIELGDLETIYKFKNLLRGKKIDMKIFIVQPGVDSKSITSDMEYLLSCTQSYLIDTYNVPLTLICS